MQQPIYLDYAAATPLSETVLNKMRPYWTERFYNPSSLYLSAKDVATELEGARQLIAHWLGARSTEIVFVAGGTEANNLAINGVMQSFPGGHIVATNIEHDSVLEPVRRHNHTLVAVDNAGVASEAKIAAAINDKTVLVSVVYANNEIGTIQPLRRIAQQIEQIRHQRLASDNRLPLWLHTDAAQAGNYLSVNAWQLGVDLMTINGGKLYGPKQTGALYVRTGVTLSPEILGGGQESGRRSGTENVAGMIGLASALDEAQNIRRAESERLVKLQRLFIDQLRQIDGVIINGSLKHRLPNNIHATFKDQDSERLIMALDERGVQCAAGSACSASNDEPSHVLKAIGLSDQEAQSSVRFSMGRSSDESSIAQVIKILRQLILTT